MEQKPSLFANAVAQDCGATDVFVSTIAVYDLCRQGKIVDIIDFRRSGLHAFWSTKME